MRGVGLVVNQAKPQVALEILERLLDAV